MVDLGCKNTNICVSFLPPGFGDLSKTYLVKTLDFINHYCTSKLKLIFFITIYVKFIVILTDGYFYG